MSSRSIRNAWNARSIANTVSLSLRAMSASSVMKAINTMSSMSTGSLLRVRV